MKLSPNREDGSSRYRYTKTAILRHMFLAPDGMVTKQRTARRGFTLVELLVSMTILIVLGAVILQILSATTKATLYSYKHMDTDTQARTVFDRMAIDFGRMVIRKDVDYYIKQAVASSVPTGATGYPDQYKAVNAELATAGVPGNDQIAFYSEVPGYYPATGTTSAQSQLSLAAYRINADATSTRYNTMERLGKGLVWTSTSNTNIANGIDVPIVFYPTTLATIWPQAASATATDSNNDYEAIGPEVFRFEYYYNLKKSTSSTLTNFLSNTPWDSTLTNHTSLNGWQDVASITVVIAVVDSRTRPLLTQNQITTLAGNMVDFDSTNTRTWTPGQLESSWRTAIQTAITQNAISAPLATHIRVYSRTFYLNTPTP